MEPRGAFVRHVSDTYTRSDLGKTLLGVLLHPVACQPSPISILFGHANVILDLKIKSASEIAYKRIVLPQARWLFSVHD